MPSDIKLEENKVVIECDLVEARATGLMLDNPAKRTNKSPHRRALVHDANDSLTLNFGRDYPGGVTVEGGLKVGSGGLTIENGVARMKALSVNHVIAEPGNGEIFFQGRSLKLSSVKTDVEIDGPSGKALTHARGDTLVINDGGNYKGGVKIEGEVRLPGKVRVAGELNFPSSVSAVGALLGVSKELVIKGAKILVISQDFIQSQSQVTTARELDIVKEVEKFSEMFVGDDATLPGKLTVKEGINIPGTVTEFKEGAPGVLGTLGTRKNELIISGDTIIAKTTFIPLVSTKKGPKEEVVKLDLVSEVERLRREVNSLKRKVAALEAK